jgi:adenylate cyclase
MAGERVERRLAAVLAADVAGYSRLMGADEIGTLAALKRHRREIVDPSIAAHNGRIVKTTGDGMLVEFASAVDAVTCAVEVQQKMADRAADETAPRILFRVGKNVGDIIIDSDDIFGDGVNVAARVENECEPGCVCLSGSAFEQVRGKTSIVFDELGERPLKNIDRPVRLYSARPAGAKASTSVNLPGETVGLPPLPDRPSIAVLPFQNMSGDPEQEYFADGMVEEIITALSRFKWLFVIARNSSFTFKGQAVNIKEVGRRLGVRYVLEGSVRNASGKVRITGQLIDALTGAHIWADRFERDLTDIFALQDEVTAAVVSAIQPKLLQTEIAMATRRRPDNLTAYDLFLRMLPQYYLANRESMAEAIQLAHRALELDPRYAFVAAIAGACHILNVLWGYSTDPQSDRAAAVRLARLALSLDDDDAETLAFVAATLALSGDYDPAVEIADRSVKLNSNSFHAWHGRGTVYRASGLWDEAIRSQQIAMRLSPVDPLLHQSFTVMGMALIQLGRFDEAVVAATKALRQRPFLSTAHACLTSALANLGRDAEAREAAARLLEVDPAFTITERIVGSRQSSGRIIEGLMKVGLPD